MQKSGSLFSVLQKVGQSLMVPVSVLPAAGLLVALGRMMQDWAASSANGASGTTAAAVVVTSPLLMTLGKICFSGGLAIFEQLPVVFAVGVAIGFTGGAGVAGLASAVGYFTLVNVIKVVGEARHIEMAINTGVFGGILTGLFTAVLYRRFYQTKLPPVFGFFSGKRLVPIVTAGAAIFVGIALGFIWPPIQELIKNFGAHMVNSSFGPAFYAAGKRFLIPVGLHHVYYPSFLFEFGTYTTAAGKVLHGESARYFAGDPTAGRFMASEFPLMLFGLPAACLAMVLRAEKSKRTAVAGVMLSAALTSIITGITEPIEFAFIFVAPLLFVFHVLFAFASGMLTGWFDIHLGYTFSASAIDFVLGFFNQKNSLTLFTVVGPLVGLTYFLSFYWAIGAFNLKTPGREVDGDIDVDINLSASDRTVEILKALGGAANIKDLDACITRLRLSVVNSSELSIPKLKALGAAGVLNAGGGNFQVIFGVESDSIKDELQTLVAQSSSVPASSVKICHVMAPMTGAVLSIESVPDKTFSERLMGDGLAIDPTDGTVLSPVNAVVTQLFRTHHAIGLTTEEGVELLIHVGLDTVKMKGDGFTAFVKKGDQVKAGQKLIEFDLEKVRKQAKSTISPIVVTNSGEWKGLKSVAAKNVVASDSFFDLTLG